MGAFVRAESCSTNRLIDGSSFSGKGVADSGQSIRSGWVWPAASVSDQRVLMISGSFAGSHLTVAGMSGWTNATRAKGTVYCGRLTLSWTWTERHTRNRKSASRNSGLLLRRPTSPSRKSRCANAARPMFAATTTNDTPTAPVKAATWSMLLVFASHWVAASGIHGNPPKSHVRLHSTSAHAPAMPSIATRRTGVGLPTILGMAHHAARYHDPVHAPTRGPSMRRPTHVTGCSQPRLIVHASAWAANMVQA